ncbi:hypothetical protein [Aureispira sp. CCB-QB1]|uniref:hypothetical protein n=1 Tax=Aureispira sp. CCB-QB1 TaxID=1313421 RepID=UPI0006986FE0|nr:hypothetical protein [Aureispira sp. CCB-QB1]
MFLGGGILLIMLGVIVILQTLKDNKFIEPKKYRGKEGLLRINLKWFTEDDLDLHVCDPCGNVIYYDNKRAECGMNNSIGCLDLDANHTNLRKDPQENIHWELNAPEGEYRIYVDFFKRNSKQKKVKFVISIISQNDEIIEIGRTIEEGNKIEVAKFEYKDYKIKSYKEI